MKQMAEFFTDNDEQIALQKYLTGELSINKIFHFKILEKRNAFSDCTLFLEKGMWLLDIVSK